VFQETLDSPPLVPQEADQEAPLPAEEVTAAGEETTLVERITVSDHFMLVEHVAERRTRPGRPEIAA
jgi:hypothetical protein